MDENRSQGPVGLAMEWLTFMPTRMLHNPVCLEGDGEGVRSWSRPLAAGRGPAGADDGSPVEETGNN